ncbi:hypothetical protein [Streptomyces sp. MMBL 11-3]|uniref:hypothetical protein n=1 Tax=Streptomyces sp. MMBL 11-3 TaxID=3382639 RepID=UPI0039B65892
MRELLDTQRARVPAAFTGLNAEGHMLDELAMYGVAVNQSLAVLSRADVPDAELRNLAAPDA